MGKHVRGYARVGCELRSVVCARRWDRVHAYKLWKAAESEPDGVRDLRTALIVVTLMKQQKATIPDTILVQYGLAQWEWRISKLSTTYQDSSCYTVRSQSC